MERVLYSLRYIHVERVHFPLRTSQAWSRYLHHALPSTNLAPILKPLDLPTVSEDPVLRVETIAHATMPQRLHIVLDNPDSALYWEKGGRV